MGILIQDGTVYDGSGSPPIEADILIEGERIAAMGARLTAHGAAPRATINARGRVVCPGFIDIHRHADVAMFTSAGFGETELAQGITSVVVGNCGIAPVPGAGLARAEYYRYIEPVVGHIAAGLPFADYAVYAGALERACLPLNVGFLAAGGAIKTAVKGFAKTPFSAAEMRDAVAYIEQAKEHGALGLSFGIMYQPECYSSREELTALARVAGDGILCTHIRGEGDSLVSSIEEMLDVAFNAGVPLNISHFKASGVRNWRNAIYRAIERIEAARNAGQRVGADFYPYDGGSTTILSLIPPSVLEESTVALVQKLGTSAGRETLRQEFRKSHAGWDNMAASIGWERVIISSVINPECAGYCGKSMKQIACENGCGEPLDLLCDLVVSEEGQVGIIVLSMAQEDIDEVARLPWTALISDALYGGGVHPHPRLHGAFPRFLREYVRERKVLTMEQAIHKMTLMGAERLGIRDRGVLRVGAYADVLVFDPACFVDRAGYQHPAQMAVGMETVILNGNLLSPNDINRAKAGQMIFRSS
ncbi:MAG: amidohydrolase family protein [Treponema sp.]|jgi:N-acyl-D-aspartate/D-glutamate deacylase|nr:amidohydrolase family protein [Treponema sp.]